MIRNNKKWYHEEPLKSWCEVVEYFNDNCKNNLNKWIFRGQKKGERELETSLERILKRRKEYDIADFRKIEKKIIWNFKRQSKIYLHNPPLDEDYLEWISIIQHFGGPTRLLDWTYSFFVAAYFAIHNVEPKDKNTCAIWALDVEWWRNESLNPLSEELKRSYLGSSTNKDPKRFDKLLESSEPVVLHVTPFYMFDRLSNQQGVFTICTTKNKTLWDTLKELQDRNENKKALLKITMPLTKDNIKNALDDFGNMNITRSSLFPGLDGYAQSFIDFAITYSTNKRDK